MKWTDEVLSKQLLNFQVRAFEACVVKRKISQKYANIVKTAAEYAIKVESRSEHIDR